jgi:uncharacterized coiled-coil protein SlyX
LRGDLPLCLGMPDELEQRLEKLESHLAHVEREYEQLNEVVIEQSRLLSRMQKELGKTSRAVETIELERIKANVQKPPHYGP